VPALRARHGADRVVATDVRMPPLAAARSHDGHFERLDCTKLQHIHEIVRRYDVGTIYHLAALLSAVAEERPQTAWDVNMGGLYRILEAARQHRCAVFFPSSIGAFGPTTPRDRTPQDTIQHPTTMYGVTKASGELLCDYYAHRFGIDTRGLRLPGLISHVAPPGGGTTDYAVHIFHQAVRYKHYTCFLRADTSLDMMYMPDAVQAILQLMDADPARLAHRNSFNVTAMNFTPERLAVEIRRHIPDFAIDYAVDPLRQAIADSWPRSIDDGAARAEWGWMPAFDIAQMTADMLARLQERLRGEA
jgi:nucleoside-diphosphate-sugar epimerase